MKMKKEYIIGTVILFLIFGTMGCASMKYENYVFSGKQAVFNDPLIKGGVVEYEPGDGVITFNDGMLYMKDADFPNDEPEAYEGDPWVYLDETMGRNSLVSFDLMLGEEQPEFQLNLMLLRNTHQRMNFIMRDEDIHFFISTKNEPEFYQKFPDNSGLTAGKWNNIRIILAEEKALLFVNGRKRSSYSIPEELSEGTIGFECHGEARIRDLSVYSINGYEIQK